MPIGLTAYLYLYSVAEQHLNIDLHNWKDKVYFPITTSHVLQPIKAAKLPDGPAKSSDIRRYAYSFYFAAENQPALQIPSTYN